MVADTQFLYIGLIAVVAFLRLVELRISRRNVRRLLAAGGREAGAGHYPFMVALHTLFLVSCPAEVVLLRRPFLPVLGWTMTALLVAAFVTRHWVIRTLGGRWTTRVIVLPGASRIESGPYRFLRHPNYAAVSLEIAALPLIHAAWITALLFGIANLLLLRTRIRVEEAALERSG